MINNNSLKLTIFQPLPYTRMAIENKSDIADTYEKMLKKIDAEPVGCEAIMKFNYHFGDDVAINLIEMGFAAPPTEEVRVAVLNGDTIPLPPHDMELEPGKYELIQIPIPPQPKSLFSTFVPFICSNMNQKRGTFHFRLLKENAFAVLSQIILSLEE
jgi:hypothetical protein